LRGRNSSVPQLSLIFSLSARSSVVINDLKPHPHTADVSDDGFAAIKLTGLGRVEFLVSKVVR